MGGQALLPWLAVRQYCLRYERRAWPPISALGWVVPKPYVLRGSLFENLVYGVLCHWRATGAR